MYDYDLFYNSINNLKYNVYTIKLIINTLDKLHNYNGTFCPSGVGIVMNK